MTNYELLQKRTRGVNTSSILSEAEHGFICWKAVDIFIQHYVIEQDFGSIDENIAILQELSYYIDIVAGIEVKDILLENIYDYLKDGEYWFTNTTFDNCYKAGKAFSLWDSKVTMVNALLNY